MPYDAPPDGSRRPNRPLRASADRRRGGRLEATVSVDPYEVRVGLARTLARLDVDLGAIVTRETLQSGIAYAVGNLRASG